LAMGWLMPMINIDNSLNQKQGDSTEISAVGVAAGAASKILVGADNSLPRRHASHSAANRLPRVKATHAAPMTATTHAAAACKSGCEWCGDKHCGQCRTEY
jgi:hypothetical protein